MNSSIATVWSIAPKKLSEFKISLFQVKADSEDGVRLQTTILCKYDAMLLKLSHRPSLRGSISLQGKTRDDKEENVHAACMCIRNIDFLCCTRHISRVSPKFSYPCLVTLFYSQVRVQKTWLSSVEF